MKFTNLTKPFCKFILALTPLIYSSFIFAQSTQSSLNTNGLGTFFINQNGGNAPPAALVRFHGQSLDSKAYVVGCGHCNGMPKDDYVYNIDVEQKKVYLFNKLGKQKALTVDKIIYGTQSDVDLILLQLSETYQEILDKYAIESRFLSKNIYDYNTSIYIFNLEITQECTINQVSSIFDIPDTSGRLILKDAYLYFNDCQSIPGYSGSILISKKTNEVIGLNIGGFPETNYTDIKYVSFASNVYQLYSCMNSAFQFDINLKSCLLKIEKPTENKDVTTVKTLYNDLNGLAIVGPCSGGIVMKANAKLSDNVLILTNGHCLNLKRLLNRKQAYLYAGETLRNLQRYNMVEPPVISIFSDKKSFLVDADEVVFATMTETDVAIIKLNFTYEELFNKYMIQPKIYDPQVIFKNKDIRLHSSFYNRIQNCQIIDTVNLREDVYTTIGALKLSAECAYHDGYSGSVLLIGNHIVGLANTHFSGTSDLCSLHNPCEISADGKALNNRTDQSYGVNLLKTPLAN